MQEWIYKDITAKYRYLRYKLLYSEKYLTHTKYICLYSGSHLTSMHCESQTPAPILYPCLIWQQIKMQIYGWIRMGFFSLFNKTVRLSIQIAVFFFIFGLTKQAKQVTHTSVKSFKLEGNNVLLYGYIRGMAQAQTKLSIFNVPVCVCVCVHMCVDGWVRGRVRVRERGGTSQTLSHSLSLM